MTFCKASDLHVKIQANSCYTEKFCFFNPLRTDEKSVCPLVEGSSTVVGVLYVFVDNCITKRFSQRPITTHLYWKVCGAGAWTIKASMPNQVFCVWLWVMLNHRAAQPFWCWWGSMRQCWLEGTANYDSLRSVGAMGRGLHCRNGDFWFFHLEVTANSDCQVEVCSVFVGFEKVMKKVLRFLNALLLLKAKELLKLNFSVVSCKFICAYWCIMWRIGRNISD